MKVIKYPIHITNQLNTSGEVKTRIQMIYQRASSRANLLKYSLLLLLFFLAYSLHVFRSQMVSWFYQPNPDVAFNMLDIQPQASDTTSFGDALYYLTSPEITLQLKKGAYAGFGFPKMEAQTYPRVQLLSNDGTIISTNVKSGQTYFGFKCVIPETGNYTIKMLDDRPQQMMHYISQRKNVNALIGVFTFDKKSGHKQVQLEKGTTYSFAILEDYYLPGIMTLYQNKKRLANNVTEDGEIGNGLLYRCLESGTYYLDYQSKKVPSQIEISIWKH